MIDQILGWVELHPYVLIAVAFVVVPLLLLLDHQRAKERTWRRPKGCECGDSRCEDRESIDQLHRRPD